MSNPEQWVHAISNVRSRPYLLTMVTTTRYTPTSKHRSCTMRHTRGRLTCMFKVKWSGWPTSYSLDTYNWCQSQLQPAPLEKRARGQDGTRLLPAPLWRIPLHFHVARLRIKQREHERKRKTFAYTDYTGMTISEESTKPNKTKPHVPQAVQQPRCLMRTLRAPHPDMRTPNI